MKDDRFEELLREAVADSCNGILDSLPEPEELEELTFSSAFETKMARLIARIGRRERIKRLLANAAAVFLVLLMGAGIWLAVNVEARAAFTTWMREMYEDSFVYWFFNERSGNALPEYTLGWVPEGYEEIDYQVTEFDTLAIYSYDKDYIYFSYFEGNENTLLDIAFVKEYKTVYINGLAADLHLGFEGKQNSLVWIDEKSGIVFGIHSLLPEDAMIAMAESVRLK